MAQSAATPDHKENDSYEYPLHYLMWFRRDLRVHDNTALAAICERADNDNAKVSAVFFITPDQWREHETSTAQVDHILRTLPILATNLYEQLNIALNVYVCPSFNDCITAITALCQQKNSPLVMANHEYEGNEIARDKAITEQLAERDIEFIRHHDQCILPPGSITTNDDTMYKVFTPFFNKWRDTLEAGAIEPHNANAVQANNADKMSYQSMTLDDALSAHTVDTIEKLSTQASDDYLNSIKNAKDNQTTTHIDHEAQLANARDNYPAGESAAKARLAAFITDDINDYDVSRDVPSRQATSHLSAYLTIGAISARQCYLQAAAAQDKLHGNDSDNEDINRWISELAWRDFYRHVLADKPRLIYHHAYKEDIDKKVNWSYNEDDFHAWAMGKTGVPLVDAAMRCLNSTGFMHNRLRMVTAMFLTKDLLIDWRLGERYFMQQLIDGDFASNNGGWQWSASTGTDSAPYFRIMNPFSQAKSHDPDAIFIKTWLPELKDVPASILHSEDKMRKALTTSNKKTGNKQSDGKFVHIDYPKPMVEHKKARQLAISEFKKD